LDRQRILKEAQKIAKDYSFWMVSGNIAHLYGYVHETPEKKFELEIKFDENFPSKPPQLIYHTEVTELLGDFELTKIRDWTPESSVIEIVEELKVKIQDSLHLLQKSSENQIISPEVESKPDLITETEEYITPDLDAYPPDFQYEEFLISSDSEIDNSHEEKPEITPSYESTPDSVKSSNHVPDMQIQEKIVQEDTKLSIALNTELGLIQQEYTYDQVGQNAADVNIYITITLTKTFIIKVDFTRYPEKPIIYLPREIEKLLEDPHKDLATLRNWDSKKPFHIVDLLHELEKKLYFLKDLETQTKKITGEYQSEKGHESFTSLKVSLLTYGFKEYALDIDLQTYPNPPTINLPSELQQIINIPVSQLKSYKNWIENESEPVEIIREISWLVDKNSRINFEIDLLKDHYQEIKYDPIAATLRVDMKGKMKTEDLTFEFQIILPEEYPMKIPEIKVLNEFDLEAHEKIKNLVI
jgi:ubiquitin-protein ligase